MRQRVKERPRLSSRHPLFLGLLGVVAHISPLSGAGLPHYPSPMRIQFCGADRTVTGSSHLIEVSGLRVFLDMGMYQGPREESRRINSYLPADVRSADAI